MWSSSKFKFKIACLLSLTPLAKYWASLWVRTWSLDIIYANAPSQILLKWQVLIHCDPKYNASLWRDLGNAAIFSTLKVGKERLCWMWGGLCKVTCVSMPGTKKSDVLFLGHLPTHASFPCFRPVITTCFPWRHSVPLFLI